MILRNFILLIGVLVFGACQVEGERIFSEYPKAHVSYSDYEGLVEKVRKVRADRLISFDKLLRFQLDSNTVILDTRSRDKYNVIHVKGAVNLPFTEFTQSNLSYIIPNTHTRLIIYCNNNFLGDQINLASKSFFPLVTRETALIKSSDSIMLALNVPTYINLFGYGYRNIYELDELVNIDDTRLELGGGSGSRISKL